ncbi:hypothetical protein [Microbacterium sp. NPDC096154]|uniref:hypothetical protein n=1 Tax=Microbacterium sp. NPDC096154 TaxID=3155549 RepID=UPI003321E616
MSADLRAALAALERSPLSRRKAMLLILMIDAEVERRAAGDPLAHRIAVAASDPSLALVLEVAGMRDDGPRLVTAPVTLADHETLQVSEADYMVSLYNAGEVWRLFTAWPDGRRVEALPTLRAAVTSLG